MWHIDTESPQCIARIYIYQTKKDNRIDKGGQMEVKRKAHAMPCHVVERMTVSLVKYNFERKCLRVNAHTRKPLNVKLPEVIC